MNRLLVICPTRGRPERCREMYESFVKTSTRETDIIFLLDEDDPCREKYIKLLKEEHSDMLIRSFWETHKTLTTFINKMFSIYHNYEFYSITNDDFVYHTPGWDQVLMNKGKISFGDDMFSGDRMPTTSVIDGDIVRAVGWLQLPDIETLYGDAAWKMIGHKLNILKYFPEVKIEHKHFLTKKVEKDETYERTNSKEQYKKDHQSFREYIHTELDNDVKKIKGVLDGNVTERD